MINGGNGSKSQSSRFNGLRIRGRAHQMTASTRAEYPTLNGARVHEDRRYGITYRSKAPYMDRASVRLAETRPRQLKEMTMDIVKALRGELLDCQCCAAGMYECACDTVWPESVCKEAADEIERLRKIEEAAVWAVESPQWRGDDFDNCMYALDAALKGEK